jgi:hypothetical protein
MFICGMQVTSDRNGVCLFSPWSFVICPWSFVLRSLFWIEEQRILIKSLKSTSDNQ